MEQTILTIDVGTSSMRGILFSSEGAMLHTSRITYTPVCNENTSEISSTLLSDALISVCKSCAAFAHSAKYVICGLSITSQRSSFLPVDKEGNPLMNFITWQDRRCLPVCDSLKEYNSSIFKKTGLSLSHVPLAPKLMWYILNQPESDKKTAKYLTIADYLNYVMTGEYKTDYTYGSRTLLMNIHTMSWDDELLRIFHVKKEKLCELIPQGSIIGTLTKSFARATGLETGLPVISAGGDQQCSTLGSLCVAEGDMLVTVGTGSYVAALTDHVHVTNSSIICGASAIPEKYQLEATILAGADIFNWYHRTFYPASFDYDEINKEIASSPIGSNGIIMLPHFHGKGSPNWNPDATGLFYGVNSSCSRGDFARSILEGIAFEIDENLVFLQKELASFSPTNTPTQKSKNFSSYLQTAETALNIRSAGGLTNSLIFNQMLADSSRHKIYCCQSKETTSLGAFLSASVTLGFFCDFENAVNVQLKRQQLSTPYDTTYFPVPESMQKYVKIKEKRNQIYSNLFLH